VYQPTTYIPRPTTYIPRPVAAPAPVPAPRPACLVKEYMEDGTPVFQDLCTGEVGVGVQEQEQPQGAPQPQGVPQPQVAPHPQGAPPAAPFQQRPRGI